VAREECLRYVRGFLDAERKLGRQLEGMDKAKGAREPETNRRTTQ